MSDSQKGGDEEMCELDLDLNLECLKQEPQDGSFYNLDFLDMAVG